MRLCITIAQTQSPSFSPSSSGTCVAFFRSLIWFLGFCLRSVAEKGRGVEGERRIFWCLVVRWSTCFRFLCVVVEDGGTSYSREGNWAGSGFAFRPVDRGWASFSWWLLLVRDATDTSITK